MMNLGSSVTGDSKLHVMGRTHHACHSWLRTESVLLVLSTSPPPPLQRVSSPLNSNRWWRVRATIDNGGEGSASESLFPDVTVLLRNAINVAGLPSKSTWLQDLARRLHKVGGSHAGGSAAVMIFGVLKSDSK